jgi:hypothetical protein
VFDLVEQLTDEDKQTILYVVNQIESKIILRYIGFDLYLEDNKEILLILLYPKAWPKDTEEDYDVCLDVLKEEWLDISQAISEKVLILTY